MDARDAYENLKSYLADASTPVLYADGQGRYDCGRAFAVAVPVEPDGTVCLSWPCSASSAVTSKH